MYEEKLADLKARVSELRIKLQQPETLANPDNLASFAREHNELTNLIDSIEKFNTVLKSLSEAENIIQAGDDPVLVRIAEEEIGSLRDEFDWLKSKIEAFFNPQDPLDNKNAILEIRSGTGGDEAALFAMDL